MAREKKSMIGFDPLSWLDDEVEDRTNNKTTAVKKKKTTKKKRVENNPEKNNPEKNNTAKNNREKKTKKPAKVIIKILEHSLDETALLKGYELVSEVLNEAVFDFYTELFKLYPAIKPLFENTSDRDQAIKLSAALKFLVNNLHDENALKTTILSMGARHQAYGALQDHYPIVAELLLASFKNKIGRAWTKAINSAWLEILIASAETMYAAYEEQTNEMRLDAGPMVKISGGDDPDENIPDENKPEENKPEENKPEKNKPEAVMSVEETAPKSLHPVLVLNVIQDISKSQALKNDMLTLINDNDEINIDASDVERIDGSALQLLCALFNYAHQNNLVINWLKPSEAFTQSAKTLGVQKILELN